MLLVILPLFIGSTVRTVGWMILFARGGMMDIVVQRLFGRASISMYTSVAVIFGIVSINLPFMVLTLQSVFEGIDTRLEEAARGLGAAPGRAFWRVVWPLALPGVGIAAILSLHPEHERLRDAGAARRPALSDDGAAAVLGVRQQQQLAVRGRARVHPDGDDAAADHAFEHGDSAPLSRVNGDGGE